MATVGNVMVGMQTIARHTKRGLDGYDLTAEHDIIRMSSPWEREEDTPKAVHDSLIALGWHWCSECDMWACFV